MTANMTHAFELRTNPMPRPSTKAARECGTILAMLPMSNRFQGDFVREFG
jgi:hypothetical protein